MKKNLRVFTMFLCAVILSGSLAFAEISASAASALLSVDFESGVQGFAARGGTEKVAVTSKEAHGGKKSLLVSNRTDSWNGAGIESSQYIKTSVLYEINIWVLPKSAQAYDYSLTAQIEVDGNYEYRSINTKNVSKKDGWTLLCGEFKYSGGEKPDAIIFYVESGSKTAEYYIDDFSVNEIIYNNTQVPSLYQRYENNFLLGTVFGDTDGQYFDMVRRHFNVLTAENAMKPTSLSSQKGVYNFSDIDKKMGDILSADITVHGHTLAWHEQSSAWLTQDSKGNTLTRAEAIKNMTSYVNKVAGHFKGKVYSWDVLNEAISDGLAGVPADWSNALRKNVPWYLTFANGAKKGETGADYVETLYRLARKADPNAVLYYNDYGLDNQIKAAAVAKMVKSINDKYLAQGNKRLLIEGIGMQGHYNLNTITADVEKTIKLFENIGVEISISELDITIFGWQETGTPTEALYKKQAEVYAKLFKIFIKHSSSIKRVTFWGLDDEHSWLKESYPLLFDKELNPKLAYFAVYDPDGYLAGNYDTAKQRDNWIKNNTPILKSVVDKKVKSLKGSFSTQFTLDTVSKTRQKTVTFSQKYAGKTVKLYRYDGALNKFYSVCTVKIAANGKCVYTDIKKAGDYLAVII